MRFLLHVHGKLDEFVGAFGKRLLSCRILVRVFWRLRYC